MLLLKKISENSLLIAVRSRLLDLLLKEMEAQRASLTLISKMKPMLKTLSKNQAKNLMAEL